MNTDLTSASTNEVGARLKAVDKMCHEDCQYLPAIGGGECDLRSCPLFWIHHVKGNADDVILISRAICSMCYICSARYSLTGDDCDVVVCPLWPYRDWSCGLADRK